MHDFSLLHVDSRVSGKFPEIAWQTIHSRQAVLASLLFFLGSLRNRLVRKPCTARRPKPRNLIYGFLMNYLAVMNIHQATQINLGSILMFGCSGMILIRGKSSVSG